MKKYARFYSENTFVGLLLVETCPCAMLLSHSINGLVTRFMHIIFILEKYSMQDVHASASNVGDEFLFDFNSIVRFIKSVVYMTHPSVICN